MKFSRNLIFLATILIVVSIISMYFGSVKSVEGATVGCPGGSTGTASTDSSGNPVLNCPDTATPTTTVSSYYKSGSPACSVSGTGFTNSICGGGVALSANTCKSYNTVEKKWYNPDTKNYVGGPASKLDGTSKKYTCP